MILSFLLEVLLAIVVFFLCIFTHEIGHAISIRVLTGKNPTLQIKRWEFKLKYDFKDKITDNQEYFIIGSGVFLGVIPLFAFADKLSFPLFLIVLVCYIVGSGYDIKRLIQINRKNKKKGWRV